MKKISLFLLLTVVSLNTFAQKITQHDDGLETFVDEESYIRVFSKVDLVSYELWDLTRDKRKLSQVINAPKGSKVTNYIIINPRRLKEGEYMIKLIRQDDVKKVWFDLPRYKDRERTFE